MATIKTQREVESRRKRGEAERKREAIGAAIQMRFAKMFRQWRKHEALSHGAAWN